MRGVRAKMRSMERAKEWCRRCVEECLGLRDMRTGMRCVVRAMGCFRMRSVKTEKWCVGGAVVGCG